jgi:hypothetical protein
MRLIVDGSMSKLFQHFHDGSEGNVKESTISDKPVEAVRELSFIKSKLETGS